jgi:protein phosphatase PTC7
MSYLAANLHCIFVSYPAPATAVAATRNIAGSSTACVLVVNGTTLSASNLGDSGFVLVRDGVATFQCPQQQHNFNFPFQLGSADSMSDQPQAAMVSECVLNGVLKHKV